MNIDYWMMLVNVKFRLKSSIIIGKTLLYLIRFQILVMVNVRYEIPKPFGPLTLALWYGPWPRPLVQGRALGRLCHGPRSRAVILDPRHIGPIMLAQTPRGAIWALPGQLCLEREHNCSGVPFLGCPV